LYDSFGYSAAEKMELCSLVNTCIKVRLTELYWLSDGAAILNTHRALSL
jgi:hypothetical protein